MTLGGKIIVLDNVLSVEECVNAVKTFHLSRLRRSEDMEIYRDTFLLHINERTEMLQSLSYKIRDAISFLTSDVDIDWCQVVEWRPGSQQAYHKDTTDANTVLTSITYLNVDFEGGETSFFNDLSIVPKIGRTVYFDGNHYTHGVNRINKGLRYTLPIWYKQISVV